MDMALVMHPPDPLRNLYARNQAFLVLLACVVCGFTAGPLTDIIINYLQLGKACSSMPM